MQRNIKQNKTVIELANGEIEDYSRNLFKGDLLNSPLGNALGKSGIRVACVHKSNILRPKNQRPIDASTVKYMAKNFIPEAGFVVLLEKVKKRGKKTFYFYEIHDGQHRALANPEEYVLSIIVSEKDWRGYELWDACNDPRGHKPISSEDRFWNNYHGGCKVAKELYNHLTQKHKLKIVHSKKVTLGCYSGIGEIWKHCKSKSFMGMSQSDRIKTIKTFTDLVFCWFDKKDFIVSGSKNRIQTKSTLWNQLKKGQDDLIKMLDLNSWMSSKKYLSYVFDYADENGMSDTIKDWQLFRAHLMKNEASSSDSAWLKDSLALFFKKVNKYILNCQSNKKEKVSVEKMQDIITSDLFQKFLRQTQTQKTELITK